MGRDDFNEQEQDGIAPLPFNRGSLTSELAAISKEATREVDEQRVMRALRAAGDAGLMDDDLEVWLGMTHQSVSARRNGLVRKGLVCDSGRTRQTRSRRKAVVWIVGKSEDLSFGPTPERTPRRPTKGVLLRAVTEIETKFLGTSSEDLIALLHWLKAVAR